MDMRGGQSVASRLIEDASGRFLVVMADLANGLAVSPGLVCDSDTGLKPFRLRFRGNVFFVRSPWTYEDRIVTEQCGDGVAFDPSRFAVMPTGRSKKKWGAKGKANFSVF